MVHTLAFHPTSSGYILAQGSVSGSVSIVSLSDLSSGPSVVAQTPMLDPSGPVAHASSSSFTAIAARAMRSVRTLAYTPSGDALLGGLASGILFALDSETLTPVWSVEDATLHSMARRWRQDDRKAAEHAFAAAKRLGSADGKWASGGGGGNGSGKKKMSDREGVAAALAEVKAGLGDDRDEFEDEGYYGGSGSGGFGGNGGGDDDDDEGSAVAVNVVCAINDQAFAVGDDNGLIRVWDVRTPNYVRSIPMHEDYVSDLTVGGDGTLLMSTSGDGRLGAFDLGQNKPLAESEEVDYDLIGLCVLRSGSRVVAAAESGDLAIYESGMFGAPVDRYNVLSSVSTMEKVSDEAFALAADDGSVRVVCIQPNALVDVVAEHDVEVSALACTADGVLLASAGHDNTIKFTNLTSVHDQVNVIMYKPHAAAPRQAVVKRPERRKVKEFYSGL